MPQYRVNKAFLADYRRISEFNNNPEGKQFLPGQVIDDWAPLDKREVYDWGERRGRIYTFTYEGKQFRWQCLFAEEADELVARI